MNYFINCIHCGLTRLNIIEVRQYAFRGELAGVQCPNCNEEAMLLKHITLNDLFIDVRAGHLQGK